MFRSLVVLSALVLAACQGKPQRRAAPEGRVNLTKPSAANLHDRAACPTMLNGEWNTGEGQTLKIRDDGAKMTLTTSDDGVAREVDGVPRTENGVTTVAYCANGALNYAFLNGERKVEMKITTENLLKGKLSSKTEYLDVTGKKVASGPLEREYTLSRPSVDPQS